MEINEKLLSGPNQYTGFGGVYWEFELPFNQQFPASLIDAEWIKFAGHKERLWNDELENQEISFLALQVMIASYLHCPDAFANYKSISFGDNIDTKRCWIILRYLHLDLARFVLKLSYDLASEIFSAIDQEQPVILGNRSNLINNALNQINKILPPFHVQLMMNIAIKKGIPFYPTSPNSKVWQFGQGALGKHIFHGINEFNSATSNIICVNKIWSNEIVKQLGYPCVVHSVVRTQDEAFKIANNFGYPVVVKPIDGVRGLGVTPLIQDSRRLKTALILAGKYSSKGVIVERHVNGIDHRLAVFGSKLAWVSAKHAPYVIGDGKRSISDLIEEENHRRSLENTWLPISKDESLIQHLADNRLSLDYYPALEEKVSLRAVANISQGGTVEDLTDCIHPDNRVMAETLARVLKMDTMGIDFISEDIRKSWRESACAIIEINQTSEFRESSKAELIMSRLFMVNDCGRIPSILVVESQPKLSHDVLSILEKTGLHVGWADPSQTLLGDELRGRKEDDLKARVHTLLADPLCESLLVSTNVDHIVNQGVPLDRFDLALISEELPLSTENVISSSCKEVMRVKNGSINNTSLEVSILSLAKQFQAQTK